MFGLLIRLLPIAQTVLKLVDGKKTYSFAALLAALGLGDLAGFVPPDSRESLYMMIVAGIAWALREAVAKAGLTLSTEQSQTLAKQLLEQWQKYLGSVVPTPAPTPDVLSPIRPRLLTDAELRAVERTALDPAYHASETIVAGDGAEATVAPEAVAAEQPVRPVAAHFPRVFSPVLLMAFCLLPIAGHCAQPTARITGPDRVERGDIVKMSAEDCEGVPTHYSWDITPKLENKRQLLLLEDGRLVQVATYPGTYTIELIVSNADGHTKALRTLVVTDPNPCPPPVPPAPTPDPSPEPRPVPTPGPPPVPVPPPAPQPLPAGRYGLAQATYDLASKVDSSTRASEALCLANSCRDLRAKLGGDVKRTQDVIGAVGAALDRCTPKAWDNARTKLAERLQELMTLGTLRTLTDWGDVLGEIETGLRAVK